MIDRIASWLQRTFAFLRNHRTLALALAIAILAALVILPPYPFP